MRVSFNLFFVLQTLISVEIFAGCSPEICRFRASILADLQTFISRQFSNDGARLGALVCTLYDFDTLRASIDEAVTLLKLFSPHKAEVWDEIIYSDCCTKFSS